MTQEQNRPEENSDPQYDPVFEKLIVNTEEDSHERLIGMIAYAEWKLDNPSNNQPNERQLKKYLKEAQEIVGDFGGKLVYSVAQEYFEELLNDADVSQELRIVELRLAENLKQELKDMESRLISEIRANNIGYWESKPIWHSYVASWFFAITFPIIALLVWWAAHDSGVFNFLKNKFFPDTPQPIPTNQYSPNRKYQKSDE